VALTEIRAEPIVHGQADHRPAWAPRCWPRRRPSGSPSVGPAPPWAPPRGLRKHAASISKVVGARSSVAKRTNRQREKAITAQKMCRLPSEPQSMASTSPGAHTPGRRPRWLSGPPGPPWPGPPGAGSYGPSPYNQRAVAAGKNGLAVYAGRGLGHPSCDDVSYDVVVVAAGGAGRALGGLAAAGPTLNYLVVDAADGGGSSRNCPGRI